MGQSTRVLIAALLVGQLPYQKLLPYQREWVDTPTGLGGIDQFVVDLMEFVEMRRKSWSFRKGLDTRVLDSYNC